MSTNMQSLSKINQAIILISGAYLFFVTLVLAPFINLPIFYSFHVTTKLLFITSAALIALFQLWFFVPRLSLAVFKKLPRSFYYAVLFVVISFVLTTIFSSSFVTSLFGMFTSWENNTMTFIIYVILFLAWLVYFRLLKEYSMSSFVFQTLMTLAVIVSCVYALGEFYLWKDSSAAVSSGVTRIQLGFRNPLLAAYYLGMLWSFTFERMSSFFSKESAEKKNFLASIFYVLLFALCSHALLLTFTRSAWIAAALSAAALVAINLVQRTTTRRYWISILLAVVIVGIQSYAFRSQINQRNSDILGDSQSTLTAIASTLGKTDPKDALGFYQQVQNYSSAKIRTLEWVWGLRTVTGSVKNFLFGIGSDAAFFEMPKYRNPVFNEIPTDASVKPYYVRSLYINFLLEHGVFGVLSVLALVTLIAKALKNRRFISPFTLPAISILVAYFAQGIFYYPTHITTVLAVFAFSFTLIEFTAPTTVTFSKPTITEKVLLLALATLLLAWIIPITQAEYVLSMYKQSPVPFEESVMQKNATIGINNNVLRRYFVYHYPDNALAQGYMLVLSRSNDPDDLRTAGDAYYLRAKGLKSTEDAKKSITVLEKLSKIDGSLPVTWDSLGLRYLYIKDFTNAKKAFEKAIDLKVDYWYAYMHIGELTRQQCNPKEAIDWYHKAEKYIPSAEVEIAEAEKEIKTPRPECIR